MSDDRRGIYLILLGMLFFSTQDVLIRQLSDHASLTQIIFIRGIIGGLILLFFLKLTKRSISFSSSYPLLAISRVLLFFTGFLCFYFALGKMELAEVSSLFFVSPLFITILSKFIFKSEIGAYRICAIIVGFAGVLFIVKPNLGEFNKIALLPIISAFTYSVSMMIAKYTREKDSVFQQMLHMYFGSAVLAFVAWLIIPLIEFEPSQAKNLEFLTRDWSIYNSSVLLMFLGVAVIGSSGMLLLTSAYRVGSPPVIAPFEYIMLIFAIGNGFFFFSEMPDIYSILGMLLIVGSGFFIFIREGAKKESVALKTSLRT
jgi:drug/metabolite transporter (DMT)-like permease